MLPISFHIADKVKGKKEWRVWEHELTMTLTHIGKTFDCQRVGNKSVKISEAPRLSEISRSPHVEILSMVKNKLLNLTPPITRNEAPYRVDLYEFWRQHIFHIPSYLPRNQKSNSFWMGLRTRKGSATEPGCHAYRAPLKLHNLADPVVLDVAAADERTFVALSRSPEAPVSKSFGEKLCYPLRITVLFRNNFWLATWP